MDMRVPMSGLSYSPRLEARLAARHFLYTWDKFCELEGEEQSEVVAAYRIERHIEAVFQFEIARSSKRKK